MLNGDQSRIKYWLPLVLIGVAAAIVCWALLHERSKTTQQFPDGTVLQLDAAAKGAHGSFVSGDAVQKTLWRWFGNSELKRGLRWLKISPPTTNSVESSAGDGMLSFWFAVKQTRRSARELYDYLRAEYLVEIVNLNGPNFTNKCYAGVRPDAALVFLRTLGPPTNQPAAIRFLAREGTNWKTACEFPIANLRDFSKASTK